MRPASWFTALFVALLLAGCSSSAPGTMRSSSTAEPQSPPLPERPIPHSPEPEPGFRTAVEAGTRTERGVPGPEYWQQHVHYELTGRVLPAQKRLEGSARITYTNHSPDTLRQLHMEFAQNLHKPGVVRNETAPVTGGVEVERVVVDGMPLHLSLSGPRYQLANTQLVLIPEQSLPPGASTTIEIDWAFPIPQAGAGARMGHSNDDLFFLAYWYPQMSVYDDVVGWMTEPFMSRAEFYSDFADYDFTVEAPPGWIVAATGMLQNPNEVLRPEVVQRLNEARASDTPVQILSPGEDGTRASTDDSLRWRFRAEQVRDVAFSLTRHGYWEAARTPVGDRDGDGQTDYTTINTLYRPTAPLWSEVTRYQQHAITYHSEHTDFPYPWPHMTAVEGGGIIGGGMEFPMMTLMGDYNGRSDSALYAVTAHELAHMWVPMVVSNNERRYSWMDEGTTTFNENDARTNFYRNSTAVRTDQQTYLQVARAELEGPIMRWANFHYTDLAFGIASYPKPASMLVALRGLLGEQTFLAAYRRFIDTWAYKHPYPADFFNTFEDLSGRDLDWFWDSWYYETWTLDQAVDAVRQEENGAATVVVRDYSKAPMPVRLTVTRVDNSMSQHAVPVDVWLRGATEATVELPAGPRIQRIEIDPEHHFPDINRGNNVWTAGERQRTSN